jgi:hypothetical protein
MFTLIKFNVGTRIWLVPNQLVNDSFRSAVTKLNQSLLTSDPVEIDWTDEERWAIKKVKFCDDTWIPV